MPFRLAVIGAGKIARDQHLPAIAKTGDFQLAAIVDPRPAEAGFPSYPTLPELLASGPKLDAVAICTPPGPRFELARQALEAGLHVLIEKPPTATMGEFASLAALAATRGRVLFTAWHSQYNAAVDEAQRLLAGETVMRLHIEWKEDVRHWHPGQEWIWEPGGFGVFDPGINAFSIVTKILPQPVFVAAARLEVPRNRATPIAAQIRFKPSWPGAAELTADLDWRQTGPQTWTITVETRSGLRLELRNGGSELHVDGAHKIAAPRREYELIYAAFAKHLAAGRAHADGAPLQLVSDCFLLGRQVAAADFA